MPIRIRRIKGKAGNAPGEWIALENVLNAFTYLPSPATNVQRISGAYDVGWKLKLFGGYDNNEGLYMLSQLISMERGGPAASLVFGAHIRVGLTYKYNRGIMAWPDFGTCISHAADMEERTFEKTAHEICHCLRFGHVRNSDESCNDWGMFNTTCEPHRYEGRLPDVPFRVRLNEVINIELSRDLMGYANKGDRFLNPDFWLRAIEKIEDKW